MNTAADTGSAHHHYMSIDQMYKCNVYTKWITVYSRIWCMYHTYIPVLLCKVGDILPKAYILTVIMSHFDNNTNYTIRIFHDCSLRLCFFTVLKMIMYKILQKISVWGKLYQIIKSYTLVFDSFIAIVQPRIQLIFM